MPGPPELHILHVDMDAFFAAIEVLDNPALAGKPIVVGHDGPRGVVSTASYEARVFGCHSAQPVATAKRLCPHVIVVPVRGSRYREVSEQVFAILHEVSPLVQPLSIDEAFVDVKGVPLEKGDGIRIAGWIKRKINDVTGLTASVGVAPNKFLAKLASDMDKPDGLTVIGPEPERIQATLDPLPIRKMWGVGPATAAKFERLGIHTFADLRTWSLDRLARQLGQAGAEHYYHLCRGIDHRKVTPDREAKSISQEHTFGQDVADRDAVRQLLLGQTEQVARRLRRHHRHAKTVHLKLRYGDFETIMRSASLDQPTDLTQALWQATATLYDRWASQSFQPVRLIGMGVSHLSEGDEQLGLFDADTHERQRKVDSTLDAIQERFGKGAIGRGTKAGSDGIG